MPTEADTCRRFVVPKLQAVGWDNEPSSIAEQRTITDGRIVPVGKSFIRRPPKRIDYLLRYRRDFPLAVLQAKVEYKKIPFFFKQWGGVRKDLTGRLLGGRTYDEMADRVAA